MGEGPVVLVRFGAALLAIAGTVLVLSIAFVGIGISARRAFGLRGVSLDDCLLSFWLGYSLTLLFLICWNFASPVGLAALLTVLAAGAAWRDPRTVRTGGGSRRPLVETAHMGVARARGRQSLGGDSRRAGVCQLGWRALSRPGRQMGEQPMPSFPASRTSTVLWRSTTAAFCTTPWSIPVVGRTRYHVANAVLLHGGVMQALINGLQWCRGRLPANHRLFSFLMLPLALHVAREAASYSTDLPVALVLSAAVALLYRMLDEADRPARTEDSYAVFALATLLAAAVSIKLTAAVFATVSLLIGVIVLLRKEPRTAARLGRSLTWTALIVIVFGGAWVARGVVMSGYPFFPIAIAGFPVDWRAPVEHANVEAAYIQFTSMNSRWISSTVGAADPVERRQCRVRPWRDRRICGCLRLAFDTAPQPGRCGRQDLLACGADRYRHPRLAGHGAVASLQPAAILVVGRLVRHRMFAGHLAGCRRSRRQFGYAALTAIACRRSTSIRSRSRYGKDAIRCRSSRGTISVGRASLRAGAAWRDGRRRAVHARSADTLNVPARLTGQRAMPNACWGAPLPCTPNPAPNLEVRVPADLRYGFRVNGAWEMQDWPSTGDRSFCRSGAAGIRRPRRRPDESIDVFDRLHDPRRRLVRPAPAGSPRR